MTCLFIEPPNTKNIVTDFPQGTVVCQEGKIWGVKSLFPYLLLQQLPGGLDLGDILKRVLWDHKKRSGGKINMKEIGRFLESGKALPAPLLYSFLGFQQDAPVVQAQDERIQEGSRSFINAQGQDPPYGDPEKEPEYGKNKEGQGLDPFEPQKDRRQDGKNIDHNDQDPDLRPSKKVPPQSIEHLLFIVSELNSHSGVLEPENKDYLRTECQPRNRAIKTRIRATKTRSSLAKNKAVRAGTAFKFIFTFGV